MSKKENIENVENIENDTTPAEVGETTKKGKSLIDYMTDEDYARYSELIAKAEEAKANAPKAPRAPRGPMTVEQKKKNTQARIDKLKAQLDALLASEAGEEVVDAE